MTCTVPMKVSASPDGTRSKVHRLCHLVLPQHIPTDVSSHSMADSRDKLHQTRHHPIHAQNFTNKSHSTSPHHVTSMFCNFRQESYISTVSDFSSYFWCPKYQVDPASSDSDLERRNKATSWRISRVMTGNFGAKRSAEPQYVKVREMWSAHDF